MRYRPTTIVCFSSKPIRPMLSIPPNSSHPSQHSPLASPSRLTYNWLWAQIAQGRRNARARNNFLATLKSSTQ